jgi:hypothetical protein
MKSLSLVGLHFIQRTTPGFHGQIVAADPFVLADVYDWRTHKPDGTVRAFSLDDVRAFDLYRTRAAWFAAVKVIDDANKKKATA